MKIELNHYKQQNIVQVWSAAPVITDLSTALDLMLSLSYEHSSPLIALNKEAFTDDFFILSTGLAGDILQKCVNYNIKLAIYGDYSSYTSKPLKDFIYESNRTGHYFFVPTLEDACEKLHSAL